MYVNVDYITHFVDQRKRKHAVVVAVVLDKCAPKWCE